MSKKALTWFSLMKEDRDINFQINFTIEDIFLSFDFKHMTKRRHTDYYIIHTKESLYLNGRN